MSERQFDPMTDLDVKPLRFYDRRSGREMIYVYPDTKHWTAGWICYKHPDGQFVTLRKATDADIKTMRSAYLCEHGCGRNDCPSCCDPIEAYSVPAEAPAPAQPTPAEPSAVQHPEAFCKECGGVNPVWFAPNDVWNELVPQVSGILCPNCFMKRNLEVVWKVEPERHAAAPASEPSSQPLCRCPEGVCLIHRNSSPDNCGFKHHTTAPAAEAENVALRERVKELEKQKAELHRAWRDQWLETHRQLELCRETVAKWSNPYCGISTQFLEELLDVLQPKAASPYVREEKLNG